MTWMEVVRDICVGFALVGIILRVAPHIDRIQRENDEKYGPRNEWDQMV
ncbi:hypothetical protein [Blastomonas sp.]